MLAFLIAAGGRIAIWIRPQNSIGSPAGEAKPALPRRLRAGSRRSTHARSHLPLAALVASAAAQQTAAVAPAAQKTVAAAPSIATCGKVAKALGVVPAGNTLVRARGGVFRARGDHWLRVGGSRDGIEARPECSLFDPNLPSSRQLQFCPTDAAFGTFAQGLGLVAGGKAGTLEAQLLVAAAANPAVFKQVRASLRSSGSSAAQRCHLAVHPLGSSLSPEPPPRPPAAPLAPTPTPSTWRRLTHLNASDFSSLASKPIPPAFPPPKVLLFHTVPGVLPAAKLKDGAVLTTALPKATLRLLADADGWDVAHLGPEHEEHEGEEEGEDEEEEEAEDKRLKPGEHTDEVVATDLTFEGPFSPKASKYVVHALSEVMVPLAAEAALDKLKASLAVRRASRVGPGGARYVT